MRLLENSVFDLIVKGAGSSRLTYADLGANEGELTCAMWEKLNERRGIVVPDSTSLTAMATGVDIDSTLIERAGGRVEALPEALRGSVTFQSGNIADPDILEERLAKVKGDGGGRITLISLFSTTMWVHVHLGDEKFLDFIKNLCSHSEFLLIEPQPEKCYTSANKRLRKQGKEEFDVGKLKILRTGWKGKDKKGEGVERAIARVVEGEGFVRVEATNHGESGWGRSIMIFRRKEGKDEETKQHL